MTELKEPDGPGPVPQAELENATIERVEKTSDFSGYVVPDRTAVNPYQVEEGSALTGGAWGVRPGLIQGHTVGGNYKPGNLEPESVVTHEDRTVDLTKEAAKDAKAIQEAL